MNRGWVMKWCWITVWATINSTFFELGLTASHTGMVSDIARSPNVQKVHGLSMNCRRLSRMWVLNFSGLRRRRSATKNIHCLWDPSHEIYFSAFFAFHRTLWLCFRKPQQAAKCLKLNLRNGVAEEQMPFLGTGHTKSIVAGFPVYVPVQSKGH